jgi:predicted Zn-dependent peptidase
MKNTTILGRAVFILVMATASEVSATRIDYSSFTLTNGMTVLLSRDSSVPVVAVSMLVGVGSRNEQPGRTGFAHLFEHMMFEGSQHVPKGKFERILESVGGRYNAFTKENFTFYFELMPSAALETALWLNADRIKALNVNHEAVKNQISVVGEEKRMRVDNEPYGFLYYAGISSHSFENWHNSHSIIGSFEDLEAATLTDVQSFHRAYYSPDNITMALVGDFDPVDARHLVEKYFGSIYCFNLSSI